MNSNPPPQTSEQARRELADQLHSLAIHLLRDVRSEDLAAGIGPAQLSALSILVFRGPTTPSELAAMEQITAPSMSRIIDGLVKADLARRWQERADRRRIRVVATRKGTALLEEARSRRLDALTARIRNLDASQIDTCIDAVKLLTGVWQPAARTGAG